MHRAFGEAVMGLVPVFGCLCCFIVGWMPFKSTKLSGHPWTSVDDELLVSVTRDSQFVSLWILWRVELLDLCDWRVGNKVCFISQFILWMITFEHKENTYSFLLMCLNLQKLWNHLYCIVTSCEMIVIPNTSSIVRCSFTTVLAHN
jgi:hypothetical protein